MNLGVLALIYFIFGWCWATLVIYKNWLVRWESTHSFGFLFFMWPFDILRRIFFKIGDWMDAYHIWIVQHRKK